MAFVHIDGKTIKTEKWEKSEGITYSMPITSKESDAMSAGAFTMAPGAVFEDDGEVSEVFYVTEGSVTVTCGGESYCLKKGDFGSIQKGTKSVFKTDTGFSKIWATYPHFE